MIRDPDARLSRFLADFVAEHPGTRTGWLFGRPAAFAGRKAFAEITDQGLACRLPLSLVRGRYPGVQVRQVSGRSDWILAAPAPGQLEGASTLLLLEVAAARAAELASIAPRPAP